MTRIDAAQKSDDPLADDDHDYDDDHDHDQSDLRTHWQETWWPLAKEALLVGFVAAMVAAWVMQIWKLQLGVPFSADGDALFHVSAIADIRESGWYLHNDRLAAPFGQDARDFPFGGENIHWLSLKLLGYGAPSVGATMNLYLFLSYPIVAVTTFVVARRLGLDRSASTFVGLLFAFMPFHNQRLSGHLLRVNYFYVPLGVLVVFRVLAWQKLRTANAMGRTRWSRERVVPLLLVAVLLGASDTQHAVFGSLILLVCAVAVSLRDLDPRPVWFAVLFGGIAAFSLLLNNTPALIARLQRGANPDAIARGAFESELYGLRPVALVVPTSTHRWGPFAELGQSMLETAVPNAGEVRSQALGVIGALGLLAVLGVTAAAAAGRRVLRSAPIDLASCGLIAGAAILLGSVGAFPSLLSTLGFTQIRTWGRISLWIAFVSLLAAAALLHLAMRSLRSRVIRLGVVIVAVSFGLADLVDPGVLRVSAAQEARTEAWTRDETFYRQVEAALPAGAMVHQMPIARFPEAGPIVGMGDYEHLDAFVHTSELRWSYGGMRGRPEGEWLQALATFAIDQQLALVATVGFDAVLVDRRGFADRGANVEAVLQRLGATPLVKHPSGNRIVYDIGGLAEQLASGISAGDVLDGLTVTARYPSDQFWPLEGSGTDQPWRWSVGSSAEFVLSAPTAHAVRFIARFDHIDPRATSVVVETMGRREVIPVGEGDDGVLSLDVDLPAGETTVRLSSDGGARPAGPRRVAIFVGQPRILSAPVARVVCAVSPAPEICGAPAP